MHLEQGRPRLLRGQRWKLPPEGSGKAYGTCPGRQYSNEEQAGQGGTTDKIFLLSEEEVTTGDYLKEQGITDKDDYGFAAYTESGQGSTRIRVTTDRAKATVHTSPLPRSIAN